jgi:hypothetical protein
MMRAIVLLCLLVALPLAAACGGDDRLSTDEYREQARRICVDADRATERIEQPTRATAEAIADYFKRLLEANDRTTKRFEALEPPEELEQAHDDALEANAEAIKVVREVIDELERGGDSREVLTRAQSRLQELRRRSGDAADRLGVPECADE